MKKIIVIALVLGLVGCSQPPKEETETQSVLDFRCEGYIIEPFFSFEESVEADDAGNITLYKEKRVIQRELDEAFYNKMESEYKEIFWNEIELADLLEELTFEVFIDSEKGEITFQKTVDYTKLKDGNAVQGIDPLFFTVEEFKESPHCQNKISTQKPEDFNTHCQVANFFNDHYESTYEWEIFMNVDQAGNLEEVKSIATLLDFGGEENRWIALSEGIDGWLYPPAATQFHFLVQGNTMVGTTYINLKELDPGEVDISHPKTLQEFIGNMENILCESTSSSK